MASVNGATLASSSASMGATMGSQVVSLSGTSGNNQVVSTAGVKASPMSSSWFGADVSVPTHADRTYIGG